MNSTIYSSTINGIKGRSVKVECLISGGYPNIKIIGIKPSEALKNKERVVGAIKSSKIHNRPKKVRISISPEVSTRWAKELDISIALSMIKCYQPNLFPKNKNIAALGKLSLNGNLTCEKGFIQFCDAIEKEFNNKPIIIIPKGIDPQFYNYLPKKAEIIIARNFKECIHKIKTEKYIKADSVISKSSKITLSRPKPEIPFDSVQQLKLAKRALLISVTGKHHLLIAGPIGIGKSILTKAAIEIFPNPNKEEINQILSINQLFTNRLSDFKVPIEKIDSKTTRTEFIGRRSRSDYGKAIKSNNGILLVDDLPDLNKKVLLSLKETLDNKYLEENSYELPTNFLMLGTANLCKCGRYGNNDKNKPCKCTPSERVRYLKRIPDSLINRIDLVQFVTSEVKIKKINKHSKPQYTSNDLLNSANKAKDLQIKRFKKESYLYNSQIPIQDFSKYCRLDSSSEQLLSKAKKRLKMNGRDIIKTVRIARTIADLGSHKKIMRDDILEAISYRTKSLLDLIE